MKHYVLIGYPRSGTAWLATHFREYYKENYIGEFFSINVDKQNRKFNALKHYSIDDKILNSLEYKDHLSFLEEERGKGNEYYIKYMVHQIEKINSKYSNWWDNFYNNFEKIKLLNKNVWRIFLSESYQQSIDWNNSSIWKDRDYILKPFSIRLDRISSFAKTYARYINYNNYNTLFDYDEITDEYVATHLGNLKFRHRQRFVHDYESYLQQDVELIKDILKKELEKNGLTYLQNDKIKI